MKRAFLLFFCLFLIGNRLAADVENTSYEKPGLDEAVADLRATNIEWQRNDTEFRNLRQQAGMSDTEVHEFAQFVAGLKRQVFEACQVVRELGGEPEQQGVDCKVAEGQSPAHAGTSTQTARGSTREEQAQQLRSALEKLEAEFDGMILIQQGKIREKASSRPPAGGSAKAGTGSGEETGDAAGSTTLAGGAATDSQAESMQGSGEPGASPGVKKQGKPPARQLPGGVGDGSDDDVVARQLREAAQAETDPVLRVQLWDEYKKYKGSIQ